MNIALQAPTPLEYFAMLVRPGQDEAQFPLLEAAASLAQDDYPDLDVQQVLVEVDELALRLRQRLAADASAVHRLRMLNHFFFENLHFGGNLNDYHDPDNSYLHRVLARRLGIPVSLAVLWLELARGIGLDAQGVGFPGHFLVRVNLPQGGGQTQMVIVDPFSGESLSREELQARLDAWHAGSIRHGGDASAMPQFAHYLQAAAPRDILARMLRNLEEIHRSQGHAARLAAVRTRLAVLLSEQEISP